MFHFKSSTVKSSVSEKEKDVSQQTNEDQIPVYSNDSGNMYNQTEKMKEEKSQALRKENDGGLQNEINKEKGKQTKGVEEKLYKLNPRKELDTEEKGMEASQGRQFFFQTLWLVKHVHQIYLHQLLKFLCQSKGITYQSVFAELTHLNF